ELVENFDEAKRLYKQAIDDHVDERAALASLARVHLHQKNRNDAINCLKQLIDHKDISPQDKTQMNRLMVALVDEGGDHKQTLQKLQQLNLLDAAPNQGAEPDLAAERLRLAFLAQQ